MSLRPRTPDPERVAKLEELEIHHGGHRSFAQGHCALELVAWIAHEKHSDKPACCSLLIANFVRRWNDRLPDNASRAKLLRPLLVAMVGTAGSTALELRRAYALIDWMVRVSLPTWLDLAGLTVRAAELRALPEVVDMVTAEAAGVVVRQARQDARAASAAAYDAVYAAVYAAASAAASAAAYDAVYAAAYDAASAAAYDAVSAAAYDAVYAAAYDAVYDAVKTKLSATTEVLQLSAQALVLRLCEMRDLEPGVGS